VTKLFLFRWKVDHENASRIVLHLPDTRKEEVDCLLDILYTGTSGLLSQQVRSLWTVYSLLHLDEGGGLPKPQKWTKIARPGEASSVHLQVCLGPRHICTYQCYVGVGG
jgi:hypothetical protein